MAETMNQITLDESPKHVFRHRVQMVVALVLGLSLGVFLNLLGAVIWVYFVEAALLSVFIVLYDRRWPTR